VHSVDVSRIDTSSVLSLVAQEAARATGASGVAVAIGNAKAMCCCASVGEAPPIGVLAGPDSGLSGICMRTSEVVQCDDTASDPRIAVSAGQQLRSVLIVPVISEGRLQGMLQAVSSKPRAFGTNDRELLCNMAERIASLLGESTLESIPSQAQQTLPGKVPSSAKPNIAVVPRSSTEPQPDNRNVSVTAAAPAENFTAQSYLKGVKANASISPAVRAAIIAGVALVVIVGAYEITHPGRASSRAASPPPSNMNATPAPAAQPDVAIEQSSLAVALEHRSAGQLTPGKLLKRVDPVYPASARSGAVVLNAVVNKDGTVGAVRLVRGPEDLAGPAIDAVRHWVYEPYRIGSAPVDAESTITVKVTPRKQQ
jgi:GAF domain/Gram-negative bacterial TonB protein C-terminal